MSDQSSNHLSSQLFSGVTYEVPVPSNKFQLPKNSCPHSVYHSAMQLQPATDRTWQVPLGYFFVEYYTGWSRLQYSTLYIIAPDSDS